MFTTPKTSREFFPNVFVKTTDFQLVFNFEQTRTVTISGEHGRMALIIQIFIHFRNSDFTIAWFVPRVTGLWRNNHFDVIIVVW